MHSNVFRLILSGFLEEGKSKDFVETTDCHINPINININPFKFANIIITNIVIIIIISKIFNKTF